MYAIVLTSEFYFSFRFISRTQCKCKKFIVSKFHVNKMNHYLVAHMYIYLNHNYIKINWYRY